MAKLLVCVDGSQYSEEAVRYAVGIAREHDSTINLMFVWTPPASAGQEMDIPLEVPDQEVARLRGAERILDEAGLKHQLVLAMGNPADEILSESAKGYDLAIMGSRGLGSVNRFVLGSVTSKVSRSIKIPLLIIPPK
ncbi:MAG: universal stress protein [Methanomassiliicoccus sp.]|nr:universal stress protein [Methanomassiliicoccus sp.]